MQRRQMLAGLGIILLIVGVFSPVAKILWVETDYFKDGEGDGVLVLILLVVAAPLLLTARYPRVAWIPVALLAALLIYDFFDVYDVVKDYGSLGWGWIPLFVGEGLLIAAAATRSKSFEAQH
jgi:hypothetical protein